MKITILALHLGYGGIEKFISNIANMFAEEYDVEIISVYKLYEKPPFYIKPNIKITYLLENLKPNKEELFSSLKGFKLINSIKQAFISLKIIFLKKNLMKRAIKNLTSDVVISTIIPHNRLLAKYGKKNTIKIATEHNYNINNKKYLNKVTKSCKAMNYLVIASKQLYEVYSNKMTDKYCQVENISLGIDSIPDKISPLNKKSITYIGRLSEEKGVLDLIDIFRLVNQKDKEIIFNIIGDGVLKQKVTDKINEYALNDCVIVHGYKDKKSIENILLETSLGINVSYTESFGLAILETFSYGIPCISFSSAQGVTEIIDNEKNGYIIKNRNKVEMADTIVELINDSTKLKEFRK